MKRIARAVCMAAAVAISACGCAGMQAYTSDIEPYSANETERNAVESLAGQYCRALRTVQQGVAASDLPDYGFTTDGCSRWPDDGWASCCVVHDIAYWCGGSEENREEADSWLMNCANGKATAMGSAMYLGVRLGGAPWLPTPWRWGYGWKAWPRGYDRPAKTESVSKILERLDIPSAVERQIGRIRP